MSRVSNSLTRTLAEHCFVYYDLPKSLDINQVFYDTWQMHFRNFAITYIVSVKANFTMKFESKLKHLNKH